MKKLLQTFLFFILCINMASAATWYVRVGGTGNGTAADNAFGTVAAAIAAASDGDVIDIGPGTFAERLRISKQLGAKG